MKLSTISQTSKNFKKSFIFKPAAILFWLAVWFIVSIIMNNSLILVSPFEVMKTLFGLAVTKVFWETVLYSFCCIATGFFLALIVAFVFAAAAFRLEWVRYLLNPLSSVIKATPVASFIILALFWIGSKNLSLFTSFLMVLPVIYSNVLQGFLQTDIEMLEMAKVFSIKRYKKLMYIYIPSVKPYLVSACSVALGMCWKAGVAAEVIGQPKGSVGERLYYSKLYFNTDELFAWTVTVIVISFAFEKLFIFLLRKVMSPSKNTKKLNGEDKKNAKSEVFEKIV